MAFIWPLMSFFKPLMAFRAVKGFQGYFIVKILLISTLVATNKPFGLLKVSKAQEVVKGSIATYKPFGHLKVSKTQKKA